MRQKITQKALVHTVIATMLINMFTYAFLPGYLYAQEISDEEQARIDAINQAQWDGALGVKSFTLPTYDTSSTSTVDPVTGDPIEHSYKNSDGTYNFSSIKMSDMFQGFSEAQHSAYASELDNIRDNPYLVQDSVYQLEIDKTVYEHVNCDELTDENEKVRCELSKNASLIDEMRANSGKDQFYGESDTILTSFEAIADGTHPYYTELQSAECEETLISGVEGETGGLVQQNVCIAATGAEERVCKAERYLRSTKVAEKALYSFPAESSQIIIEKDTFDSSAIRYCPDFDAEGQTCFEVDTVTRTEILGSDEDINDLPDDNYRVALMQWKFDESTNSKFLFGKRTYAIALDEADFAPGMDLPENLNTFFSDPIAYMPGDEIDDVAYILEGAFYPSYRNRVHVPPPWAPGYEYLHVDDENWDEVKIGVTDETTGTYVPIDTGIPETYGALLSSNYIENPDTFKIITIGEASTWYPHVAFEPVSPYAIPPAEVPDEDALETFNLRYFYPIISSHTSNYYDYPPYCFSCRSSNDGPTVISLKRLQLIFAGDLALPGTDGGNYVLPEPVDDASPTVTITGVSIDVGALYPQSTPVTVMGADSYAKLDAFDQDTYNVSEYFPTNFRVVGETVESYEITTIGRPTNKYTYEIEVELSEMGSFQVVADLHHIDEQGFRPRADEDPYCQEVIDYYRAGSIPSQASCDYEIVDANSRLTDDGVTVNWSSVGYFGFMPDWRQDGTSGLPSFCYDATISVDVENLGGFGSIDPTVACTGLEGEDYTACINGQYCSADGVSGNGTACYAIGDDIQRSFAESCSEYISDESCNYIPEQTRCESSVERDGTTVCLYESHVFECDTGTEYSTVGTRDSTEIDCGTPKYCINGECSNIEEESNTAFVRANAAMQVVQEAKDNGCVVTDGVIDEESCQLFEGVAKRCKSASVWGAPNCCNPDELGMGGMDIVAYWQLYRSLDAVTEMSGVSGYMGQAWGAVQASDVGMAVGDGLGAINTYVTDIGNEAYNFMVKPIIAGWESTFQTLGFSPEAEIVSGAADLADMSSAMASGAPAAAASTDTAVQAAAESSDQLVGMAGAVTEENVIGGIYAYLAQGINYALVEIGGTELAGQVFVVSGSEIGFNTNTTTGSFLNTAANVFGYIMLAYAIYNLYNLAVGMAFACDAEDFETTQKVKLLSAHYVGSWCSEKLFFGGCVEHSLSHCIYPSTFSRIISEQFRKVLAEDAGVNVESLWIINPSSEIRPENLDCSGFSLDEIADIDWDRVDLSEYEQILLSTLKYDPNNMPEDFVKSDYLLGATGPEAGQTYIESATGQAAIVAYASDESLATMTDEAPVVTDPDYMAWYETGEVDAGDNCIISCDTGNSFFYDSETGMCRKVENVPYAATMTCDTANGYLLVAQGDDSYACEKSTTTAVTEGCQAGFVLDEDTGLCAKDQVWYEDKVLSCPTGYQISDDQSMCERVISTAKVTNCTAYGDGFTLVDNVCQLTSLTSVAPILTCASDDYIVEDGACVLRAQVPPALDCPSPLEYDADEGSCVEVSYDSIPATYSCSHLGPDYVLNQGRCEKTETAAGVLTCDTAGGYTLVDDQCERSYFGTVDATTTCPDGYQADPSDTSTCFKRTEVPQREDPYCEDSTFTLVDDSYCQKILDESLPADILDSCPDGYDYDETTSLCSIYQILTVEAVLCEDGDEQRFNLCFERENTTPDGECPSGTVALVGGLCQGTIYEYDNPDFYCAEGYALGNTCIINDPQPADISCSDASYTLLNSVCYKDIFASTVTPTETCITGYTLEADGLCHYENIVDAQVSCPDTQYSYDSDTEMCVLEDQQNYNPDLGCPDDGNPWVAVSSTRCEMVTDTTTVTRTCDDADADDSGERCRLTGTETHSPGYCNTPYELVDGQCVYYEYERPVISCPEAADIFQTANGCAQRVNTFEAPNTSC